MRKFSFSLLPFESFSPLTVPDLQSAMITKFPSFQKTNLLCKLYPACVCVCVEHGLQQLHILVLFSSCYLLLLSLLSLGER